MSSFICDPEHFASVQAGLIQLQQSNSGHPKPYRKQWQENISMDDMVAKVRGYISTLQRLQSTCVCLQYKHHEGNRPRDIVASVRYYQTGKHRAYSLSMAGIVKGLACILYQIETEHLEEIRPLNDTEKAALEWAKDYKNGLAMYILTQSSEWNKAEWCITTNSETRLILH
jgi:hypothetical protein